MKFINFQIDLDAIRKECIEAIQTNLGDKQLTCEISVLDAPEDVKVTGIVTKAGIVYLDTLSTSWENIEVERLLEVYKLIYEQLKDK